MKSENGIGGAVNGAGKALRSAVLTGSASSGFASSSDFSSPGFFSSSGFFSSGFGR